MTATLRDIAGWFQEGLDQRAAFMIVACDTFDYEDYPVYTNAGDQFWIKYYSVKAQQMVRIMEVYDLAKPWSQQSQGRAWNIPPDNSHIEGLQK